MLEKDVKKSADDQEQTNSKVERPHRIVWSDALAKTLKKGNVKVVLLSACESGKRNSNKFDWSGVAPALLKAGIPVVIGMQYLISDATAIKFSENFYTALAGGLSLDEAVAFGRKGIMELDEDDRDQDWGVPVLYTRYSQGNLFPELQKNEQLHTTCMQDLYKDFPGFHAAENEEA